MLMSSALLRSRLPLLNYLYNSRRPRRQHPLPHHCPPILLFHCPHFLCPQLQLDHPLQPLLVGSPLCPLIPRPLPESLSLLHLLHRRLPRYLWEMPVITVYTSQTSPFQMEPF